MLQIEKIAREMPGVAHTIAICGISFVQQANGPNFGSLFIVLEPFAERQKPELNDEAIMAKLRRRWSERGQRRPGRSSSAPRRSRASASPAASR